MTGRKLRPKDLMEAIHDALLRYKLPSNIFVRPQSFQGHQVVISNTTHERIIIEIDFEEIYLKLRNSSPTDMWVLLKDGRVHPYVAAVNQKLPRCWPPESGSIPGVVGTVISCGIPWLTRKRGAQNQCHTCPNQLNCLAGG